MAEPRLWHNGSIYNLALQHARAPLDVGNIDPRNRQLQAHLNELPDPSAHLPLAPIWKMRMYQDWQNAAQDVVSVGKERFGPLRLGSKQVVFFIP